MWVSERRKFELPMSCQPRMFGYSLSRILRQFVCECVKIHASQHTMLCSFQSLCLVPVLVSASLIKLVTQTIWSCFSGWQSSFNHYSPYIWIHLHWHICIHPYAYNEQLQNHRLVFVYPFGFQKEWKKLTFYIWCCRFDMCVCVWEREIMCL